jgi:hypothetical protein
MQGAAGDGGFMQPPKPTNLNAGPWRKKRDPKKWHRFRCFMAGYDAHFRGEHCFAPPHFRDEEAKEYHEGWDAARREKQARREFDARLGGQVSGRETT